MEEKETMETLATELEQTLTKVAEGDMVSGTVTGVSDTEVTVDLGIYSEGIIKAAEVSSNPRFSIKKNIHVGDEIKAIVLTEDDGEGHILLSRKKADDIIAWDDLKELMESGAVLDVKVSGIVNGGVVTYLKGVRAFIPASQLAVGYVEDLNEYLNKVVSAKIITADSDKKKLVLSVKAVERDKAAAEKQEKMARIQVGDIMEGKVETITAYGAFIDLGDDISGLVHISQISQKRVQSVHEVLKEGDPVKVKVIAIKDGKLSLSMKALQETQEVTRPAKEETFEYKETGKATTGLGSILAGLKLDLK